MLKYRQPSVPSPILIILIFCCICAGESQIPSSSNQQALEVQIWNIPSSYGGTCSIIMSAISNNFTTQNPEGFQTFMISILDSKYDVKFQNFLSPSYIYTEKDSIKPSEICKRGELNSFFYCLSINSSNNSSARLKYNNTHFMYKFVLINIKCPNISEIAETEYHAQFKIEVPNNSSSKEIKLSSIVNYRFGKIDNRKVNIVFCIITAFGVITIMIVMYRYGKTLTIKEKWIYFLFILTDIVIKVILILVLMYILTEILGENSYDKYLTLTFIFLLGIKHIIINIGVAISFGINIKKQEANISKIQMALFVLTMLVDYKLYFLFIFQFCPFCNFDTIKFKCKKNVQRYILLLYFETVFIIVQIGLVTVCQSLITKIIFAFWLAIFAAMIATVMKATKLDINKEIEKQLDQDKQNHEHKSSPIQKMDQGELSKDEKQQQISDLAKEKEKMKSEEEIISDRPLSLVVQPYNDDKNEGGY